MRILTPQQVNDLPALLRDHRLEALALVALFTGIRRGELLALKWGNVDLDGDEVIRIREALEETRKHGLRFKAPKSEAGLRDVRLPTIVVNVLHKHRKRELERRLLLGQGKITDDILVFPEHDGAPQHPGEVSNTWSRLARRLGIAITFHELRHTHASMLIDQGVDVVTIARRLGHASAAITLNVYAHLFRKDDGKAADAINAVIGC